MSQRVSQNPSSILSSNIEHHKYKTQTILTPIPLHNYGGVSYGGVYGQQSPIPYLEIQIRHVSRLDLVWDSYNCDSLKASARAKRVAFADVS